MKFLMVILMVFGIVATSAEAQEKVALNHNM